MAELKQEQLSVDLPVEGDEVEIELEEEKSSTEEVKQEQPQEEAQQEQPQETTDKEVEEQATSVQRWCGIGHWWWIFGVTNCSRDKRRRTQSVLFDRAA